MSSLPDSTSVGHVIFVMSAGIRRRHRLAAGGVAVTALPQQKLAHEADHFELVVIAVRRETAFDDRIRDRLDAFGAHFRDTLAYGLTALLVGRAVDPDQREADDLIRILTVKCCRISVPSECPTKRALRFSARP